MYARPDTLATRDTMRAATALGSVCCLARHTHTYTHTERERQHTHHLAPGAHQKLPNVPIYVKRDLLPCQKRPIILSKASSCTQHGLGVPHFPARFVPSIATLAYTHTCTRFLWGLCLCVCVCVCVWCVWRLSSAPLAFPSFSSALFTLLFLFHPPLLSQGWEGDLRQRASVSLLHLAPLPLPRPLPLSFPLRCLLCAHATLI
jgi:hypothetical protein